MGSQKNQISELTEAFNYFDSDKDGKVTQEELKLLLEALSTNLPTYKTQSGDVDLQTFLDALTWRMRGTATEQQLTEAFQVFDHQKTGSVSVETLQQVLQTHGHEPLSDKDFKDFVAFADPQKSGSVHYANYIQRIHASK